MDFLPVTAAELDAQPDFVLVSGDAYVDHPSFGPAIIARVLQARGYLVGIIAQPDWRDADSIAALGEPRLAFLVTSGNMDSMVNRYTVAKRPRPTDSYSPGGTAGLRPDYALSVYTALIRRRFPAAAVVAGGIEASLRRLAHYDYWSDALRESTLASGDIDITVYGMGERAIVAIAERLAAGERVGAIRDIPGTAFGCDSLAGLRDYIALPAFENQAADKKEYARSFAVQYRNTDPIRGRRLCEQYKQLGRYVVQNPAAKPLSRAELDSVYALPFARESHPMYKSAGGVPAIDEVRFSLTSCRGCFGSCSFCALTFHQGRIVTSRSRESIVAEAQQLTSHPLFKGYIHDVGGPTANFRQPACRNQPLRGACSERQCLFPSPCPELIADHSDYLALLRELRALPNVKKVFIRSGIRFDYLLQDKNDDFFRELVRYHISGQLKVAPEHISDNVLRCMGKPPHRVYEKFLKKYRELNSEYGLKQYVVPYLMSSHPGCTMKDAIALAEYLKSSGHRPEQVQDFYPTPSTLATCMYYTGLDPRTMTPVYVARSPREKQTQRALINFSDPKNYQLVRAALLAEGRSDLIGYGSQCLIRPRAGDAKAPADVKTRAKPGGRAAAPRADRRSLPSAARGKHKKR